MPETLENILDRQLEQFEKLISASSALQTAIIKNDQKALNESMEHLARERNVLVDIEEDRMALLTGEGREALSMSEYLKKAEPERREGLSSRFTEVSYALNNLKDLQESNTMLLREGVQFVRVQLNAAIPNQQTKALYGRRGNVLAPQGKALDTVG
jgi:hypothetical protein